MNMFTIMMLKLWTHVHQVSPRPGTWSPHGVNLTIIVID